MFDFLFSVVIFSIDEEMRYRLPIISLISSQLLAIPSDVYHLLTNDRFLPKSFLITTLTTVHVEDPFRFLFP